MVSNLCFFSVDAPRINRTCGDLVRGGGNVVTSVGCGNVALTTNPLESVEVACSADAADATIAWFREGAAIGSTGRIRVSDGTLLIGSFEAGDAGLYMCTASNSNGADEESIDVREAGWSLSYKST